MVKIKLCGLLLIAGLCSLITSCLGNNNYETDDWALSNAQISSFSLASDSVAFLADVKFTIDQVNGRIFNVDSLPFGTSLDDKVIATVGYDCPYGVREIMFIEASGDTIQGVNDSINFSAPVIITVTAYDGLSIKTYDARINVHQVDPDVIVWEKYDVILPARTFQDMKVLTYNNFYYMYVIENSVYQLYRSDIPDVTAWEMLALSGFPEGAILSQITELAHELYVTTAAGDLYHSVDGQEWAQAEIDISIKTILGYLPASDITQRNDVLCCIAEMDGVLRFVTLDTQLICTTGQLAPDDFPLSGFGVFNYETMYYPRLVVASGRDSKGDLSNKAYATMEGLDWATLSHPNNTFSSREGAGVFYYGRTFFVVGGIEAVGASKDIFLSFDQGVTWFDKYRDLNEDYNANDEESEKYILRSYYVFPTEFEARGFMSVIIDQDNYIMLFGGKAKNDTNVLNEIWRGRVNRLGFGKER